MIGGGNIIGGIWYQKVEIVSIIIILRVCTWTAPEGRFLANAQPKTAFFAKNRRAFAVKQPCKADFVQTR